MRQFPVLPATQAIREQLERGELEGFYPRFVPWDMIMPHDQQAKLNFKKGLKEIAKEGGLDPAECISVLRRREWVNMPVDIAARDLRDMIRKWTETQRNAYGIEKRKFYKLHDLGEWQIIEMKDMKPGDIILMEDDTEYMGKNFGVFRVVEEPKLLPTSAEAQGVRTWNREEPENYSVQCECVESLDRVIFPHFKKDDDKDWKDLENQDTETVGEL